MSKVIEQAHDMVPGTKPYQLATVTTANGQRVQIPAEMKNAYCVFSAEGFDVWIRFGDGTVQVIPTAAGDSALASEVLTEDAQTPHLHIPAGQERHRRLPGGLYTHFAHVSTAATGKFRFGRLNGTGEKDDT